MKIITYLLSCLLFDLMACELFDTNKFQSSSIPIDYEHSLNSSLGKLNQDQLPFTGYSSKGCAHANCISCLANARRSKCYWCGTICSTSCDRTSNCILTQQPRYLNITSNMKLQFVLQSNKMSFKNTTDLMLSSPINLLQANLLWQSPGIIDVELSSPKSPIEIPLNVTVNIIIDGVFQNITSSQFVDIADPVITSLEPKTFIASNFALLTIVGRNIFSHYSMQISVRDRLLCGLECSFSSELEKTASCKCNVTNFKDPEVLELKISVQGRFLYTAFGQYIKIISHPEIKNLSGDTTFREAGLPFSLITSSSEDLYQVQFKAESIYNSRQSFKTFSSNQNCSFDGNVRKWFCVAPIVNQTFSLSEPFYADLIIYSHGVNISSKHRLTYLKSPQLTSANYRTSTKAVQIYCENMLNSYPFDVTLVNSVSREIFDCPHAKYLIEVGYIYCSPKDHIPELIGWKAHVQIGSWSGDSPEMTFDDQNVTFDFILHVSWIIALIVLLVCFCFRRVQRIFRKEKVTLHVKPKRRRHHHWSTISQRAGDVYNWGKRVFKKKLSSTVDKSLETTTAASQEDQDSLETLEKSRLLEKTKVVKETPTLSFKKVIPVTKFSYKKTVKSVPATKFLYKKIEMSSPTTQDLNKSGFKKTIKVIKISKIGKLLKTGKIGNKVKMNTIQVKGNTKVSVKSIKTIKMSTIKPMMSPKINLEAKGKIVKIIPKATSKITSRTIPIVPSAVPPKVKTKVLPKLKLKMVPISSTSKVTSKVYPKVTSNQTLISSPKIIAKVAPKIIPKRSLKITSQVTSKFVPKVKIRTCPHVHSKVTSKIIFPDSSKITSKKPSKSIPSVKKIESATTSEASIALLHSEELTKQNEIISKTSEASISLGQQKETIKPSEKYQTLPMELDETEEDEEISPKTLQMSAKTKQIPEKTKKNLPPSEQS